MKKLLIILFLVSPLINWGQSNDDDGYLNFIFESNLPDELYSFYNKDILSSYKINKVLNPFYLRGDFNGDGNMDYALAIIEIESNKKGILIYHTETKNHFFVGAGTKISNSNGDDYSWMDAWKVYDKKEVGIGVGETQKLILNSEAILAMKLESSSGIIYWDGKEYRWYQQGD